MFGNPAFTVILISSAISSVGIAMFDTATSWLMTSLNPNPLMVSAVQVATMAPMFLLTIPAGALADVARSAAAADRRAGRGRRDRRRVRGARLGSIWDTPSALLATTFLLGATGALAAPAWQIITPMLASRDELDSAIALNNAAYNVSRAIGPALGGLAIAAVSIVLPFWIYCLTNFAVLGALIWWRPPRKAQESLPAERLLSAMSIGVRYARNNRDLDATLIRSLAFFPFASAYWALMPLDRPHAVASGQPEFYGAADGRARPRLHRRNALRSIR